MSIAVFQAAMVQDRNHDPAPKPQVIRPDLLLATLETRR